MIEKIKTSEGSISFGLVRVQEEYVVTGFPRKFLTQKIIELSGEFKTTITDIKDEKPTTCSFQISLLPGQISNFQTKIKEMNL
ncbi:MAG: hypothetical protein WC795_01620 [Candidatus Paceibacterota bacterium]|jgi:hypothetical protein